MTYALVLELVRLPTDGPLVDRIVLTRPMFEQPAAVHWFMVDVLDRT